MRKTMIFLSVFFLQCSFGFADASEHLMKTKHTPRETKKTEYLSQAMRKLWSDHVIWTRQYIVAAVFQSPDAPIAANRLMKNQEDIGNTLVPYYGKDAAMALTNLLKEHISIAADLTQAMIAQNQKDREWADKKWHENADAIASFLSNANPYLAKNDLLSMLNKHLELTAKEASFRIKKKWQEDMANFDSIFDQALMMADTLSNGLSKQFPNEP